jgi:glycerate 2-kinase
MSERVKPPIRLIAAPNALKGSLTAVAAAQAIAAGMKRAAPDVEVVELPVADGGDGTREVLAAALGATTHELVVEDALGRPLRASWSLTPDGTALIDVATASGLARLKASERDVLAASSHGTGQLMRAALDAGVTRLILGVGGSATVDGGAGMLEALGLRWLSDDGQVVARGGAGLAAAQRLDRSAAHPVLGRCEIIVACDVTSPLLGPAGAARLFAPQKGASAEQVEKLERSLGHYAERLRENTGVPVHDLARGGAAGGIAASLHAALGATLVSGIELVLDVLDFDGHARGAALVITAEGALDAQSAQHKAPWGVAERAGRFAVPTVVLAGSIAPGLTLEPGLPFSAMFAIGSGPTDLETALQRAAADLGSSAEQVVRLFLAARRR